MQAEPEFPSFQGEWDGEQPSLDAVPGSVWGRSREGAPTSIPGPYWGHSPRTLWSK